MFAVCAKNKFTVHRELFEVRLNRNSIQAGGGDAIYKGEINALGKPHGIGRLVKSYNDVRKVVYVGEFKSGKRHGRGTQTTLLADGCSYEVCEGDWRKDRPHGRVTIHYGDGNVYVGEMRKGQRSGQGRMTGPNGDVWDGEWRFNKCWGDGLLITQHPLGGIKLYRGKRRGDQEAWRPFYPLLSPDIDYRLIISHYVGDHIAVGKLIFSNGDRYEGEFVDFVLKGQGRYTFANGAYYEGDFIDNKCRCGRGRCFDSRGRLEYSGEFLDQMYHGQGTLITDEMYYQGEFWKSMKYGVGVQETTDGSKYKGEFANDQYHGLGRLVQYNRFVYQGGFSMGEFHGYGVLTYVDGRVLRGTFINGHLQNFKTGKLSKVNLRTVR